MTPQGSADPAPHEQTVPAKTGWRHRPRRRARLSIQSKIMVMLLVSSLASLAVIGVVEYVSGRRTLMPIAAERMTQLREGQKRAIEMLFADLSNSLVIYSRGYTADEAVQAFAAGFDQLADAPPDPGQQRALENFYTDKLITPIQQATGQKLDLAAVLPTNNAQRYLQVHYTIPSAGSARRRRRRERMVGGECAIQSILSRDRDPLRISGCDAARHPRQRGLQRQQRSRAGHQHPQRPVSRIELAWRVREGNGRRFGRLRLDHRFPAVPGGRRNAHRLAGVSDWRGGQNEWRHGASAADLEGQPDHDRRPALESRRDGRHRRDVSGRPGRADAL